MIKIRHILLDSIELQQTTRCPTRTLQRYLSQTTCLKVLTTHVVICLCQTSVFIAYYSIGLSPFS